MGAHRINVGSGRDGGVAYMGTTHRCGEELWLNHGGDGHVELCVVSISGGEDIAP